VSTKAEHQHMGRVAALGCYLCRELGHGPTPAQVHHVREGLGMGQRASNWLTVPLCDRHHANSSPDGWHGQRLAWKQAGRDEMDALADTIMRLMK
jgi:hypothetical protein